MLILIVLAMFLAVGLNPVVEWLIRRGMRRGFALAVVLLGAVGALTVFVLTIAPVISEQVAQISDNAPGWLDDIQRNDRVQELDDKYDVIQRVRDYVEKGDFGQQVFGGVLGVGMAVLSALTNAIIVLVLTIYFLASLPTIKGAAYRLAPASRRARVTELGDRIIGSTGSYVAGAVFVSVCAGLSTLIFTFIVGLGEYAFALAFVVGLLSLIPVVGSVISAILITLARPDHLPHGGAGLPGLLPRLPAARGLRDLPADHDPHGRRSRASVTVVAALAGASLLGVIGALLAVPVAAALLMLTREIFIRRQDTR